jgi:hypothetical protein
MESPSDTPDAQLHADEANRLWQHGMHEERLFHDRMNFLSAMQVGLLGVFAIRYNKEPALGVFVPLTTVALSRASPAPGGRTGCRSIARWPSPSLGCSR